MIAPLPAAGATPSPAPSGDAAAAPAPGFDAMLASLVPSAPSSAAAGGQVAPQATPTPPADAATDEAVTTSPLSEDERDAEEMAVALLAPDLRFAAPPLASSPGLIANSPSAPDAVATGPIAAAGPRSAGVATPPALAERGVSSVTTPAPRAPLPNAGGDVPPASPPETALAQSVPAAPEAPAGMPHAGASFDPAIARGLAPTAAAPINQPPVGFGATAPLAGAGLPIAAQAALGGGAAAAISVPGSSTAAIADAAGAAPAPAPADAVELLPVRASAGRAAGPLSPAGPSAAPGVFARGEAVPMSATDLAPLPPVASPAMPGVATPQPIAATADAATPVTTPPDPSLIASVAPAVVPAAGAPVVFPQGGLPPLGGRGGVTSRAAAVADTAGGFDIDAVFATATDAPLTVSFRRRGEAAADPAQAAAIFALPATDAAAPLAAAGPLVAPAPATADITHHLEVAHDGAWLDQLARDIALSADRDSRMRFQLNPERLGALVVDIAGGSDAASVRFTADNEAARALIAEAQPRLVAEARAHGMRIADTQVDVASRDGGGAGAQGGAANPFAQGQQSSQQQPSGGRRGGASRLTPTTAAVSTAPGASGAERYA